MSIAALVTAFEARIPSARVIQLSNPKDKTATSKNSTQLTNASTDAHALFVMHAGAVIDTDDSVHVFAGVQAMEAVLLLYAATSTSEAERHLKRAQEIVEQAGMVRGGRDTIQMATSSEVTTTRDRTDIPDFDRKNFDGYQADPPRGGELEDPTNTSAL